MHVLMRCSDRCRGSQRRAAYPFIQPHAGAVLQHSCTCRIHLYSREAAYRPTDLRLARQVGHPVAAVASCPRQQVTPAWCDAQQHPRGGHFLCHAITCRCIEAYELIANITTLDVGFRNPTTGQPLLSQFLTYDGTVPGPSIVVQQGVQSLVRLHNHIFCNTKT